MPLAQPSTGSVEETVARCKTSPNYCRVLILEVSARARAAKQTCIPRNVSPEDVTNRIMHAVEDVLEEEPDFKDLSYAILANQIMAFVWPCGVVS